jgi:sialate O-acetylesterase
METPLMKLVAAILLPLLFWTSAIRANELVPHPLFGDNCVLQRDREVPVWGTASPGEEISVEIGGRNFHGQCNGQGEWLVKVGPFPAGGPYEMVVRGAAKSVRVKNVLVGEVWVCSGQSNMELALKRTDNATEEVARANHPAIRLFKIRTTVAVEPATGLQGRWEECTSQSAANFSAVAYYFGRRLNATLDVPVGLVSAAVGATPAEAWTSGAALAKDPDFARTVKCRQEAIDFTRKCQEEGRAEAAYADPGIQEKETAWSEEAFDDRYWLPVPVPGMFEGATGNWIDGAIWFRKTLELPAEWAGQELTLQLGKIDDEDIAWFNGVEVGRTGAGVKAPAAISRAYMVPGNLVKAGRNVVAVRVFDRSKFCGILGGDGGVKLVRKDGQAELSLAGQWRYKASLPMKSLEVYSTGDPSLPAGLYNGMVHPLIPLAIRGVIWYQGESNAWRAYKYRKLLPALIQSWRGAWGQGDFPFYYVQLANFYREQPGKPVPETELLPHINEDDWAELREAQLLALRLPNTGMAVAIDLGEANNIHPKNKQAVGLRLALWAEAKTYGKEQPCSGPLYKAMTLEEGKIRLRFDHVGAGLEARGGELKQFAIAGEDRKFVWGKAVIDGDTIVVSGDEVEKPIAVRYAWDRWPAGCNLYNKNGLPASPFRTDDWPGQTLNRP